MNAESPSPGIYIVDGTVDGVENPVFMLNEDLEYGILRRSSTLMWCYDGVNGFFQVAIPSGFNNTLKSAVGLDALTSSRTNFYSTELTRSEVTGRAAVVA